MHSVFFGQFLSSSFFPPNVYAQNYAKDNMHRFLKTIFDGTKVSLDAKVGQS
jgi:hypothetical protein